jgi:hypothetical protein
MPIGPGLIRISTGSAFNPSRLPLSRSVEAATTDRKRPFCTWRGSNAGSSTGR